MKIFTIIGARPQFVKCAPVSAALRKEHPEFLVHTGQHYDENMSHIFFDEMGIPKPDVNLDVGSGTHATQTAAMMTGLEPLMLEQKPDAVMIYGDTNSTVAGALVAAKLHIPVIHIEAGLRSFNLKMPEEINRIVADKLSKILCCPTETAIENLAKEGITNGVINTGDVMYDAVLMFKPLSEKSKFPEILGIKPKEYNLITIHRASNTDNTENLLNILNGANDSSRHSIFPIHPRTKNIMKNNGISIDSFKNIKFIEPLGYLDFMALAANAKTITTDSGGLQKEAYWHGVPCITVRNETEWVETVESGWNCLIGPNKEKITNALMNFSPSGARPEYYGNGNASEKIVEEISNIS